MDATGRLVVPKAIRARLQLEEGTRLRVREEAGRRLVLEPISEEVVPAEVNEILVIRGRLLGEIPDHREHRTRRIRSVGRSLGEGRLRYVGLLRRAGRGTSPSRPSDLVAGHAPKGGAHRGLACVCVSLGRLDRASHRAARHGRGGDRRARPPRAREGLRPASPFDLFRRHRPLQRAGATIGRRLRCSSPGHRRGGVGGAVSHLQR